MADPSVVASAREHLHQMKCRQVDGTYLIGWWRFDDFAGHIRSFKDFDLQDGDILLCGFPRSGNHWMFEILHMILDESHDFTDRTFASSFYEVMTHADDIVQTMEPPRVFSTHLTPNFLPRAVLEKNVKIIYVFRSPKDVITSFFKRTTSLPQYSFQGSWNEYFELQLTGEYAWGSWFDHLRQWNQFANDHSDIVFTSQFEKLRENPKVIIENLCRVLGKSEKLAERIADLTSFDKMKSATKEKRDEENKRWSSNNTQIAMVKGKVNTWKSTFTVAQNERFNEVFNRFVEGNALIEKVKPYI